ncbi:hypothetical protein [Nesterenkonia suensis]
MDTTTPTPNPVADLIETLRGDRSMRQLEDDCGGNPPRKTITRWLDETPEQMPTRSQIEGLARGLRVKPAVIVQTFGLAMGLWAESDWGQPQHLILDGWSDLTRTQRTAVAQIVRELQTANTQTPG